MLNTQQERCTIACAAAPPAQDAVPFPASHSQPPLQGQLLHYPSCPCDHHHQTHSLCRNATLIHQPVLHALNVRLHLFVSEVEDAAHKRASRAHRVRPAHRPHTGHAGCAAWFGTCSMPAALPASIPQRARGPCHSPTFSHPTLRRSCLAAQQQRGTHSSECSTEWVASSCPTAWMRCATSHLPWSRPCLDANLQQSSKPSRSRISKVGPVQGNNRARSRSGTSPGRPAGAAQHARQAGAAQPPPAMQPAAATPCRLARSWGCCSRQTWGRGGSRGGRQC